MARCADRLGKGIRGVPRDAMVADITPPHLRGAAYGLRQALDSAGACVGPLLAVLFMLLLSGDIKAVLWLATFPACIAVALLVIFVREPECAVPLSPHHTVFTVRNLERLGQRYWLVVILGAIFTLARFSEAFLVLRAQHMELALSLVPIIMIVMNVVYAAAAYPVGRASDNLRGRSLLLCGLAVLIVSDIVLVFAASMGMVLLGAGLWGLHMAITQGLFSKLVADTSPADLRGTAFGIFNVVTGGSVLLASVIAGALWSAYGPAATFLAGAAFASIAAIGILTYRAQPSHS